MTQNALALTRQGPLEAYVKPISAAVHLQALVSSISQHGPCVWLDSARLHPATGRWSILGWDPWLTLTARGPAITLHTTEGTRRWQANPAHALRQVIRHYGGLSTKRCGEGAGPLTKGFGGVAGTRWTGDAGRAFGLLGYLSYDFNRWIERLPPPRGPSSSMPEMVWHGMRMTVLVDHWRNRSWVVSLADPHRSRARARREALARLDAWAAGGWNTTPPPLASVGADLSLEATSSQAQFERMVEQALEYIRAGDIFQANIAQQFVARWRGSNLSLYLALRRVNPSPFACFLSWGKQAVVSCSPERLVRVEDGWVETRPIAGTRPRGTTPLEDATNSFELLMSEKERAEHIMLVDLARNDLGRVCRHGSISVDEFMTLEEYSHVIHIVSNVNGQLRVAVDPVDVIRAVFPGGTITGCPKVRCMEILRELEPVARGLYTGSIGRLGFDGTMDLNIAIRTMVVDGQRLSYHVGAGIVADSKPDREYHETLTKAEALVCALRSVCTSAKVSDTVPPLKSQTLTSAKASGTSTSSKSRKVSDTFDALRG